MSEHLQSHYSYELKSGKFVICSIRAKLMLTVATAF